MAAKASRDRLARAERKLAALESELEECRARYGEARRQGARGRELRGIEAEGRGLADRVRTGRTWLERERKDGRAR